MKVVAKTKSDPVISSVHGKPPMQMPDLLDIQKGSYREFVQEETAPTKRKVQGLQAVFSEIFPIWSYDGNTCLEFVSYSLGSPRYDLLECQSRGLNYSVPLKVKLRLKRNGAVKEEEVFMGNFPKMTPQGSFIINGAERVIVSQLHRSPGICYERMKRAGKFTLNMFRIIPTTGSWFEAECNRHQQIHLFLDKKRTRRKFLATTLLRAIGYGSDRKIIRLFCDLEDISLKGEENRRVLTGRYLASPVLGKDNTLLQEGYTLLDAEAINNLKKAGISKVEVFQPNSAVEYLISMFTADPTDSQESALKFIYRKLRPGDPPTIAKATTLVERRFFDRRKFDLGLVGRYKLNQKLGMSTSRENLKNRALRKKDIVEAIRYLMRLNSGDEDTRVDDIDHLGMRRVKQVGELLQEECRKGLLRLERLAKDKMNVYEISDETLTPHKLVNPKALTSVLRDFFGRSQLSQFMDQTNPVAELTHKRRLTALGPGGLSRKRAGFEVRDVHPTHYGRICPIETPEGPNIGLISSLSNFARVDEMGFINTPYRKVKDGKIINTINYLNADEEEKYTIAQANVRVDEKGLMLDEQVKVRRKGEFEMVSPREVDYADVSPQQLVSPAAGLIPFLEHDDANRALMGSNMQRQSVPLLATEAALVSTGMELKTARDSRVMLIAEEAGTVDEVDAQSIKIGNTVHQLKKFMRSNAGTSINQRPIVRAGQKVKKGQVIADGPGTSGGEMALGRNVLAAYMPWRGYNFEDAIVLSEKLLKEDLYTSLHVEKFEVGARDTKLGREEITRDIPNIAEEALNNLDEEGVIRIGAEVKPNDILVGKITPKSETELLPEERLLRAIFGEKAEDVKDTSLRASSGVEGIVMDIKTFSRKERSEDDQAPGQEQDQVKVISRRYKEEVSQVKKVRQEKIVKLLYGKRLAGPVVDEDTGDEIVPAKKKITKTMIRKLEAKDYHNIQIEEAGDLITKVKRVIAEAEVLLEEQDLKKSQELDQIRVGDELAPGVIKKVQVFIATKRKLSVGDKMAGRHGNKGVISKILPEEDMPFLEDGTPVDIILNPLGVPSRMNVGQVLETHLGWAAKKLGVRFVSPVFQGFTEEEVMKQMEKAELPSSGKVTLYDGRTGKPFGGKIVVGDIYVLKLHHLVADKIHARAIGPYSLVTQQPLGGKAQFGGQRLGEMEVWALEAYGAAYALQEMLTVKSDDITGRTSIYESIVKGSDKLVTGTPESFNVLIKELRSLALDVRTEKAPAAKL